MIGKLRNLSSVYFSPDGEHRTAPGSRQLLYSMEVLQDAIRSGRRVSFHYCHYDIDKKLHPRTDHDGQPRLYIVSPYRIVTVSGHCMLLAHTDSREGITHYRIDRMQDARLLENEPAQPLSSVTTRLDNVAAYLNQRPYMFSDDPVNVRFLIPRRYVGDVLDWFGMEARFTELADPDMTEVAVQVSSQAMEFWALQYGGVCEVLAPVSLRRKLAEVTAAMAERYAQPAPRPERALSRRAAEQKKVTPAEPKE